MYAITTAGRIRGKGTRRHEKQAGISFMHFPKLAQYLEYA